jgi:autophagy-related protein 16
MNEANEFYETMRSRHQAVLNWRNGASSDASGTPDRTQNGVESTQASSMAGKGMEKEDSRPTKPRDLTPPPPNKTMDPTPNG